MNGGVNASEARPDTQKPLRSNRDQRLSASRQPVLPRNALSLVRHEQMDNYSHVSPRAMPDVKSQPSPRRHQASGVKHLDDQLHALVKDGACQRDHLHGRRRFDTDEYAVTGAIHKAATS